MFSAQIQGGTNNEHGLLFNFVFFIDPLVDLIFGPHVLDDDI